MLVPTALSAVRLVRAVSGGLSPDEALGQVSFQGPRYCHGPGHQGRLA